MSDILEPQSTPPVTRRDILENSPHDRGLLGERVSFTTDTEPLPDVLEVQDRDVVVRHEGANGLPIEHRGLVIGAFTMVLISLATFYIPGASALLAGAFGGFLAKRWKRAFIAAAIASVATPATLAFLALWTKTDSLNFLSGLGFAGWTALHVVGMFIGAASGVYARPLAERRGLSRELPAE